MNNELFQQALENISEPMIEEAAQVYRRAGYRHRRKRTILRAAAIAAVIAILMTALLWPSEENYVTGPGILSVYAHATAETWDSCIESVELSEGVEFLARFRYDASMNLVQQFPFSFSVDRTLYPDMDITLSINTDAGIFYKQAPFDLSLLELSHAEQLLQLNYGQSFSVDIDKKLYWNPLGFNYSYLEAQVAQGNLDLSTAYKAHYFEKSPSFIDVIIKADDMIVGYCVIEIREVNNKTGLFAEDFSFELITMTSFPKVEGHWQNVSLKYVQQQIDIIHAEREALS